MTGGETSAKFEHMVLYAYINIWYELCLSYVIYRVMIKYFLINVRNQSLFIRGNCERTIETFGSVNQGLFPNIAIFSLILPAASVIITQQRLFCQYYCITVSSASGSPISLMLFSLLSCCMRSTILSRERPPLKYLSGSLRST
jgi:hypothetical protein